MADENNVNIDEAARRLGIAPPKVRLEIQSGRLRAFKLAGSSIWLVPVAGLAEWSEAQERRYAEVAA